MMLHWLAGGLGLYMAPMLQVNRAMNQQMKPKLEHWRPSWLRQHQLLRIARVAQDSAPARHLQDARLIQSLAKDILRSLGADTFGHFNSPSAHSEYSCTRFLTIMESARYAACNEDEQVPESWRILLSAKAVETELDPKNSPRSSPPLNLLPPAMDLSELEDLALPDAEI